MKISNKLKGIECPILISFLRWKPDVLYREDGYDMVTALEELFRHMFMTQLEPRKFFFALLESYHAYADAYENLPSAPEPAEETKEETQE